MESLSKEKIKKLVEKITSMTVELEVHALDALLYYSKEYSLKSLGDTIKTTKLKLEQIEKEFNDISK